MREEGIMCPIRNLTGRTITDRVCMRERCAWWQTLAGTCSIAVLASDLAWEIDRRERRGDYQDPS